MTQIITDHHNTTLSESMLSGERRRIVTPHGFKINVPVPTKHAGEIRTIRMRRGISLTRAAESLLNRGISVRIPLGRIVLRVYGQRIRKAMVHALGRLRKFHERHGDQQGFAHLNDFNGPRHGEWARLRWWGLIEPKPLLEGQKAKDVRGWWRLTGRGCAWLRGEISLPRVALMFDGAWIGWRDLTDRVSPTDVDDQFDLDQVLMRRPA